MSQNLVDQFAAAVEGYNAVAAAEVPVPKGPPPELRFDPKTCGNKGKAPPPSLQAADPPPPQPELPSFKKYDELLPRRGIDEGSTPAGRAASASWASSGSGSCGGCGDGLKRRRTLNWSDLEGDDVTLFQTPPRTLLSIMECRPTFFFKNHATIIPLIMQ